ncbi:MAG TPA: hypothetical protein VKY22_30800 [Bradyrhizobium sp.]|nr:hypothetical protein [Bradyrhizobium sp.]
MGWITLTEPNGGSVQLSVDQMVRIRTPVQGEVAPGANAIVDLANGQSQAVKDSPDQITAQLATTAASAKKAKSRGK